MLNLSTMKRHQFRFFPTVYAEDKQPAQKIRPSEFPLYGEPDLSRDYDLVDVKQTELEKAIKTAREATADYVQTVTEANDQIRTFVNTGIAHTKSTVDYLSDEANVMGKAAAIGVGGLAGLIIGLRGGFIRKMFWMSTGIAASASLCYPKQASVISQDVYKIGKCYALIGVNKATEAVAVYTTEFEQSGGFSNLADKVKSKISAIGSSTAETKASSTTDQSNPADKDLYTARDRK